MILFLKTLKGKYKVMINCYANVFNLKQLIETYFNLSCSDQVLINNGSICCDDNKIILLNPTFVLLSRNTVYSTTDTFHDAPNINPSPGLIQQDSDLLLPTLSNRDTDVMNDSYDIDEFQELHNSQENILNDHENMSNTSAQYDYDGHIFSTSGRESIDRLVELGYPYTVASMAYVIANHDENAAANLLFDL